MVELLQETIVPFVKCCKELVNDDGERVIKLASIKNKTKKDTKLVFRCPEGANMTLLAELMGLEEDRGEVEVRPKMIQTGGKGMFILSVVANCPNAL